MTELELQKYDRYIQKIGEIFQTEKLRNYECQIILANALLAVWLTNNTPMNIIEEKLEAMRAHYEKAFKEKLADD